MERRKILIVAKTYPSISTKYRETVCTAGILLDDNEQSLEWVRIYPVRFRQLDFDKRYPRWSIISAKIEKNDKDSRLESYRIDDSSIEIVRSIGTHDNWSERKSFVLPLEFESIQSIKDQGKSLGIIKPKSIVKYYYKKDKREWGDKQQGILDQPDFFEIPSDLEKIPYKFGYEFIENNQVKHKYSISDWEISELYRKCRDQSKKYLFEEREAEALEKVREKLEVDFLNKKDLYFIVGNLKDHRQTFMIIGLFYPPIPKNNQRSESSYQQLTLFDS
ncbi:hypothetical protein [Planktothrix sp. FACHB-1365]|uniref:hypothetical protein n=1 Tax=Planktothrix sp. FACHB-1365 TaxID=2692855 RepID=UPI001684B515|nr:hypothetical protein [Planktothrix sp. FACHB-1365]MBD2481641.1 hypothetical protein [Planktothrix sp. FACHB-1365]